LEFSEEALVTAQRNHRLRLIDEELGERLIDAIRGLVIVRNQNCPARHTRIKKLQTFQRAFVKIDIEMNKRKCCALERRGSAREKPLVIAAWQAREISLHAFEAAAIRALEEPRRIVFRRFRQTGKCI